MMLSMALGMCRLPVIFLVILPALISMMDAQFHPNWRKVASSKTHLILIHIEKRLSTEVALLYCTEMPNHFT